MSNSGLIFKTRFSFPVLWRRDTATPARVNTGHWYVVGDASPQTPPSAHHAGAVSVQVPSENLIFRAGWKVNYDATMLVNCNILPVTTRLDYHAEHAPASSQGIHLPFESFGSFDKAVKLRHHLCHKELAVVAAARIQSDTHASTVHKPGFAGQ